MSKSKTIRLRKGVSIVLRGKQWHLTIVARGKRLRLSLETSNEELALAMAEEWAERTLGASGPPRFESFEGFAQEWLENQARRLRPSTVARYRTGISEACRRLSRRPLATITRADAARLAKAMRLDSKGNPRAYGTLRNLLAGLRVMFEDARHLELVTDNPFGQIGRLLRDVAPSRSEGNEAEDSAIPYTRDEQQRLLDAITDPQDHAAVLLALRAGLRRSEVLALVWDDVDLEGRYVHIRRRLSRGVIDVPKSKASARRVPLSEAVVRCLRSLRVGQKERAVATGGEVPAAVFPAHYRRTPLTEFQQEDRFSQRFMVALRSAGIERRTGQPFHQLRHSFASELLMSGVPIFKVSRWLGHASIQLTADTYGHLIPQPGEHETLDALDGDGFVPISATKMPHASEPARRRAASQARKPWTRKGLGGERVGDRTPDRRIKSPLLYQLSYAPGRIVAGPWGCARRTAGRRLGRRAASG